MDISEKRDSSTQTTERVAIGVPSNDTWHADFALSLINLCLHSLSHYVYCAIISQRSSIIEIGRCEMVETARRIKAQKLFTVDSDMVFPADTLVKLLSHKQPIVCCDARRRRHPFTTVVKDTEGSAIDYTKPLPSLVELRSGSSACQLVDMSVFDALKKPYYKVKFNEKENSYTAEDYYFSHKAKDAGFKVWCDTELSRKIGHIGISTYTI